MFLVATHLISKTFHTLPVQKSQLCIWFQVSRDLFLMFCIKETKLTFRWGDFVRFEYNRRVFDLLVLLCHRYSRSVRFCLTCRQRSTNVFKPQGILIAELVVSFVWLSLSLSALNWTTSAFGWESHLHPWQSDIWKTFTVCSCIMEIWGIYYK